jgi:hypothetical protein
LQAPVTSVICSEIDEGRKLAIELHPQLFIHRYESDLVNELTDAFGGLQSGMLVIEGSGEVSDLLAVQLGKVGMQSRHGTRRVFQASEEINSPCFQDLHLVLYSGARDT